MDALGTRKLDVQVETKIPSESLYDFFKNNMHRFVQLFPANVKSVQIQEGGSVRTGCVMYWKYDIGITGAPMTAKIKVQAIDDENKSITMAALEGDVFKMYKNFKVKVQFNDLEDGNGSTVKWSIEYEKISVNSPDPDHYVNFAIKMSKGMDAHLRAGLG